MFKRKQEREKNIGKQISFDIIIYNVFDVFICGACKRLAEHTIDLDSWHNV